MNYLEIPVRLNTTAFDREADDLIEKLNTLVDEYEEMQKQEGFDEQSLEASRLKLEIAEVTNKLIEMRNEENKQAKSSHKNFSNMLKNIKKVGLRMLGLASVYGIVSKASHAYLSKDTELAQKLQSVWVALGSFLAPIIEDVAEIMLKAVGYINEFVKALTGIDFVARANAKALEKQAKAQKNLNNQTYDFDVVRTQKNISSDESNNGLIQLPELNQGVVTKLQELAKWLKENKTWIEAVGVALIAVFGAKAIAGLVSNIGTLIGTASGMGLAGLASLLGVLAAGVLIVITLKGAIEAYKMLQDLKTQQDELMKKNEYQKTKQDELTESYWKLRKEQKLTAEQDAMYRNNLKTTNSYLDEEIKRLGAVINISGTATTTGKKATEELKTQNNTLHSLNESYRKLYEQGLLSDEEKQDYIKSLETEMKVTQYLKEDITNLKTEYEKISGKTYTTTVKVAADITDVEHKFSWIDTFVKGWKNLFGGGSNKKYAAGGLVTQPTRAIIGEAGYNEYVIPETEDYIGRLASLINQHGGGGTTNVYLDGRLIQRQVNNRENQYNFSTNK